MPEWLTPRELQIAKYSHLTYDEIGTKLGMSPRTVKAHMEKIRLKLGVRKKRHVQDKLKELGINLD